MSNTKRTESREVRELTDDMLAAVAGGKPDARELLSEARHDFAEGDVAAGQAAIAAAGVSFGFL